MTPYTEHRDSTHDYGDIEVDIGTDSLTYILDDLDSTLNYNLAIEFFFDEDSGGTREFVVTVDGGTDTVSVPDSSLTRYTFVITSPGSSIDVKITGEDVGLTRMVLYEADGTEGGYFSSGDGEKLEEPVIPFEFALESIVPNPFVKTAQIHFSIPYNQPVTLKVYDVSGREVRTLLSGPVEAGVHSLEWNGKDNLSRQVSSGVYFIRMATPEFEANRKAVLLR